MIVLLKYYKFLYEHKINTQPFLLLRIYYIKQHNNYMKFLKRNIILSISGSSAVVNLSCSCRMDGG